jgi:Protein of unknown function (DUF3987)/Toprim domain
VSAVDKVLEHVEGVQKRRNGFWALCPAHDDHTPSLHIQEGDDGRALIICRAGCDQPRVMAALGRRGLKSGDLFADERPTSGAAKACRSRERLVKSYAILDEIGNLQGLHERWEDPATPDKKSYKWKLPNGKYSKGDINPAAMPLYNSELVASWPEGCRIVLVEGETPADALRKRGIKAVGTVCGATLTPDRDVLEVLSGHEVIAWSDNDAAGLAHMRRCAALLEGIASAVRWFEWAEAPPKGDAADHPAIEGKDHEALKALALALRDAPEVPDEPAGPEEDEVRQSSRTPGGFSVVSGGRIERERVWPTMEEEAYRGIFGRIVELAEEHTEGDPVALLASAFTAFGSSVGRGPYMQIGATRHHSNLFCGIVGDTAKGRKGSTWDPVENIMHASDRRWTDHRIQSGLSSGEGLISEVRDPIETPDKDGKMKVVDAGVTDKRLLVQEGELSQALKVMKREGNTLSPVLRNAWDGKTLKTMVKHSPLRATNPHVCILGHITTGELVKHLTETEMANGLANRFVWMLVKRSKRLPFGGEWHTVNLQPISREIVGALEFATGERRMGWADDARPLWVEAYDALTEDRPGMFGAVTARAEAQTLRLAMLYALADCSYVIRRTHVESALAVWEYAEESARYIFGDAIGDADADKVLEELKACEEGMTRTEIRDLFGRNRSGEELDRIMEVLAEVGRIRVTKHRENGSKKPVERWHAA